MYIEEQYHNLANEEEIEKEKLNETIRCQKQNIKRFTKLKGVTYATSLTKLYKRGSLNENSTKILPTSQIDDINIPNEMLQIQEQTRRVSLSIESFKINTSSLSTTTSTTTPKLSFDNNTNISNVESLSNPVKLLALQTASEETTNLKFKHMEQINKIIDEHEDEQKILENTLQSEKLLKQQILKKRIEEKRYNREKEIINKKKKDNDENGRESDNTNILSSEEILKINKELEIEEIKEMDKIDNEYNEKLKKQKEENTLSLLEKKQALGNVYQLLAAQKFSKARKKALERQEKLISFKNEHEKRLMELRNQIDMEKKQSELKLQERLLKRKKQIQIELQSQNVSNTTDMIKSESGILKLPPLTELKSSTTSISKSIDDNDDERKILEESIKQKEVMYEKLCSDQEKREIQIATEAKEAVIEALAAQATYLAFKQNTNISVNENQNTKILNESKLLLRQKSGSKDLENNNNNANNSTVEDTIDDILKKLVLYECNNAKFTMEQLRVLEQITTNIKKNIKKGGNNSEVSLVKIIRRPMNTKIAAEYSKSKEI